MVHLLAVALLVPQLGWRAGTPEPILDGEPEFVAMYWHVWESYRAGVLEEAPGGLPTPIYAPGGRLAAAELVTGSLFTRWGWRAAGTFGGMDAYLQLVDRGGAGPSFWMLADRSAAGTQERPLFGALAAWNLYRCSGDKAMLERVFSPIARMYARQSARYTDDEGRRGISAETALIPGSGGSDANDSSEVACMLLLEATYLAKCAQALGLRSAESIYRRAAADEAKRLAKMWDVDGGVFRARNEDGEPAESGTLIPLFSIAARRPELPRSATIVESLTDPAKFRTPLLYSIVPRSDAEFRPDGGVRPLLQYLMVRALIDAGDRITAAVVCESMLKGIARSWRREKQFFTEYGAVSVAPSPDARSSTFDAGYLAIAGLIEAVLGFEVDAASQTVDWNITRRDRHGIERLRFASNVATLVCRERDSSLEAPILEVRAELPFTLRVTSAGRVFTRKMPAGETIWDPR